MMQERWAEVPGYEGLYQVSDCGRVLSVRRRKLRKLNKNCSGYMQVMLSKCNNRSYPLVHRLVVEAFIPNPDEKQQINHKNGVKTNNRVENLEWCTSSENLEHRHRVLRQPGGRHRPVTCITTGEAFISAKEASRVYGVPRTSISMICQGKQKATRKNKLQFKFTEE